MNKRYCFLALLTIVFAACGDSTSSSGAKTNGDPPKRTYSEPPPLDENNIVSIAIGSKDHTTLVEALKAADYVKSVANPGPMTVFAPTNAAFDALPAGTVEELLKLEKVDDLKEVLKYHVAVSVYHPKDLKDGMKLGMANLKNVSIVNKDGKITVNGANVLASIRASNGIVHVIDQVLQPPPE